MSFAKLNLHALIPVAGTLLVSAGCSHEQSVARKYCKMYSDCDSSNFNDDYDSIGECVKSQKKWLKASNYSTKVRESDECNQASRDVQKCWVDTLSCDYWDAEEYDEWYQDLYDSCESEIEEMTDECDDAYFYFY